jgi:hypothetical protein
MHMSVGEKLYFVDVNGNEFRLIALSVEFRTEEDGKVMVCFFDTNRGRMFRGEVVTEDEHGFSFQTEYGDIITFREATVEEFDKDWRREIEGSIPRFESNEELRRWYYRQFL